MDVTWAQALGWRLGRQLLDPVGEAGVPDVVGALGAVLAMDAAAAELAVRTRRRTSAEGELQAALESGEVVKAFAFRGAVHHLRPEDGGIYLSLRCAGRQWELKSWVDFYGLGAEDWPDFRAAVREALADGPLTVGELGEALTRQRAYRHLRTVFETDPYTLMKPLTWQGDMSIAPSRDGQLTFQRLDTNPRWAGVPDLDEAGPRAIAAYLRHYGPTTTDHVHHWLGSGLSAGKKRLDGWLRGLGDRLATVDVEGTTAHVLAEDVDALASAEPSRSVRLVPGHDQWVMGPGTKDVHVVPPPVRDAVTRKANLVLVGGVVRGTWKVSGDDLTVTWLDGDAPRAAVQAEADRLVPVLGERRLVLG